MSKYSAYGALGLASLFAIMNPHLMYSGTYFFATCYGAFTVQGFLFQNLKGT